MREFANETRRTVQPHLTFQYRLGPGRTAKPDPVERLDVRRQNHINVEARILQADRDVVSLDQQTVALFGAATEVELDHQAAASGNAVETHTPSHPPQQDDRVELARPRKRLALVQDATYAQARAAVLEFLYARHKAPHLEAAA